MSAPPWVGRRTGPTLGQLLFAAVMAVGGTVLLGQLVYECVSNFAGWVR